jgi:aerobic-type carbon monoxide dehydrogenase small subunit (CoxS/CutS family)
MEKQRLRITVNGQYYELYIMPKALLVEVLRNDLGLLGTKRSCESASCGVCTVILNGLAVKSCTILALQADGGDVVTVEGLENGSKLHPLQEAFLDYGAFQCGFCTPGMLMSARAFLEENKNPTVEEIKRAIHGNLCRCTGYISIVKAVKAVAEGKYREEKA